MSNYVKTKNVKKASTFVLTTSILMGSVYPAFADTNTSKDEVVYVKLNNNGNVDNVYVVNSFDIKNTIKKHPEMYPMNIWTYTKHTGGTKHEP